MSEHEHWRASTMGVPRGTTKLRYPGFGTPAA
jgi:hypothetical protein